MRTLVAKGPQPLAPAHLRRRAAAAPPPRCHLVLLDSSGSMRRGGRLARAKGVAAWLVAQAARHGDQLGLLAFGGAGLQWLITPGPARRAAAVRLPPLGGGGGTPLAQALAASEPVLQRHPGAWLWLLSDGRCPGEPPAPRAAAQVVVVDHDDGPVAIGRCAAWAERWGARCVPAHQIQGERR
ncbi:VWA domain-containing protein [Rubrivivax sp. JA1026]|uniref:vWA domain-containing protein n=1 Tax=Rubrivivax sp. JA1026 TaxID=2710888 RepID=UPI001F0D320C|nr:VWA domain-containing protein [Rubrivivax sp. JA1026]